MMIFQLTHHEDTKMKAEKTRSFKKILQNSYIFLLFLMIIPTVYSTIILNIHTKKYDTIITNVSYANDINSIAKIVIPNELWDIVCGRKDFVQGNQYIMVNEIFSGIQAMKMNSKDSINLEKLEVANIRRRDYESIFVWWWSRHPNN